MFFELAPEEFREDVELDQEAEEPSQEDIEDDIVRGVEWFEGEQHQP